MKAIVTIALLSVAALAATPQVTTDKGPIFGYTDTFGGEAYLGVPYAAPPTGDKRFKAPVDHASWTAPRNATEFGPGCYQHCNGDAKLRALMCTPKISEDCLYLNVFLPPKNQSVSGGWPVYFFIHGGMFTWGAGGIPLYKGSEWARRESIIIVTINYRLGIFGALTTDHVQGNFNILDQRKALKWVHDNIHAFGGDKTRVTVSGQSAGATSTGVHLTSPGSWPYFQRALIISDPYGLQPFTKKMASELGKLVVIKIGCEFDDAAQQLACLQNLTAKKLLELSEHTDILPTPHEVLGDFMQWVPHVDGTVIPMQPLEAMEKGKFNRVPVYTSDTVNETIPFIMGPIKFNTTAFEMDVALDYVFGWKYGAEVAKLYGPVPADQQADTRPFFSRILTDYLFVCPSRYSMLQAVKWGVTVYNAIFDEHPSWASWYNNSPNAPCTKWVCHAFDLPSIFDTYWVLEEYMKKHGSVFPHPTPAENKLAKFTQAAYGSFVRTGKMDATLNWPPYLNATSASGIPAMTSYNYSVPIPTQHIHGFRKKYCDYFDTIGYNRF